MSATPVLEVLIIGAGFGGIGMGIRLRQEGVDDFLILERGGDIGGVWRIVRLTRIHRNSPWLVVFL